MAVDVTSGTLELYVAPELWTLSYELRGDTNNTGDQTRMFNIVNGVNVGNATGPVDNGSGAWGFFSVDVTAQFDPTIDNHLAIGYTGQNLSQNINDYGIVRKLKIESDTGIIYYGEYPKGFPYTKEQFDSGTYGPSEVAVGGEPVGTTYSFQLGDGDFPPREWDQQIKAMINDPKDPNGVASTDRGHIYFTVQYEPPAPPAPPAPPIARTRVNFDM